jgi:DNA-binding CsgD family transcriptional regulator
MGAEFEAYYAEQSFFRDDPFLKYCVPSLRPVATGAAYLDSYGYLNARETELIATAAEAGFRSGFSAVVENRGGQVEAWNLGSGLRRPEIEALRRAHEHEIRLGLLALRDRLTWAEAGGPPLSPRERQCMDLLCAGHRLKSIAAELGLALVTVDMHLKNARHKLGAQTRDQAVALYLRQSAPR